MVCAELRPDFAELARWAFQSGMRFGEITVLQWRDLDYKAGKASVRRAWKKGPGGVCYLGEPKGTSKSRRTIVMDPDMMAMVPFRPKGKE